MASLDRTMATRAMGSKTFGLIKETADDGWYHRLMSKKAIGHEQYSKQQRPDARAPGRYGNERNLTG